MKLDIWFVIFFIGLVQGLFLIVSLVLIKGKRTLSINLLISLTLCFLSLILLQLLRYYLSIEQVITLYKFGGIIPFLIGPLLMFYVISIVNVDFQITRFSYLHFLPVFISVFFLMVPSTGFLFESNGFIIIKGTHTFIYNIISLVYLIKTPYLNKGKKKWYNKKLLLNFILLQLIALILVYAIVAIEHFSPAISLESDIISSVIFIFFFFAFILAIILFPNDTLPKKNIKSQYSFSNLTNSKKDEILALVLKKLDEEKVYLNPNLNLSDFAKDINVNSNELSQVINELLGKNFNLLINQYRIDEVKRNIHNEKKSLLGIAYDSGFSSKSAFNRVFKELEGITPSLYKKSISK